MPGQWPPRDLFLEDTHRAPLVSPFTGSAGGASTFLDLTDTPAVYTGQAGLAAVVNTTETALEFVAAGGFAPEHIFYVTNDGELTSFDDVAYTDIQTALDAANALTPSQTNQYVVLVGPGTYDVGFLTVYDFVHLVGMGPDGGTSVDSGGQGSVRLTFGRTVGQGAGVLLTTIGVENVTFANLTFAYNGQTTQTNGIDSGSRNIKWINCHFQTGTGNTIDFEAWAGEFHGCTWYGTELLILGSSTISLNFYNNRFGEDSTVTATSTGAGYFYGCYFEDTAGAQAISIASPNVVWHGCNYQSLSNNNAASFTFEGRAIGCTFELNQNPSLASQTTSLLVTAGGAEFIACSFEFSGDDGNQGTVGCIFIGDLTSGDFLMTGCQLRRSGHSNALIMLGTGITTTTNRVVLNGNTFDSNDTGGGLIFGIHSTGFTGTTSVELNGNYYFGEQISMPTNAGTGRVFWRGSDVKSTFYPASAEWGTATASENSNFPGALFDLATETGFVIARANPPAGVLIDAALVLSGVHADGIQIDTMTDTDSTALSAHTPTGGGTGTWTIVSGAPVILSNKAALNTTGTDIATYSITGKNGYMKCVATANSGTGNNQAGVLFRYADTSNYWRLVNFEGVITLIKRVAGSETSFIITGGSTEVSFNGDVIRVYNGSGALVQEIIDSDLEDNTSVGLYMKDLSGRNQTVDDWEWHPGGDVDLTVETDKAEQMFPWGQDDVASANDDGVNVMHKAYTLHDIAFGITEQLGQVKVTLDVLGTDINEMYLHGMIVRHLPVNHDNLIVTGFSPVGTQHR
jgi:hypothetical protein